MNTISIQKLRSNDKFENTKKISKKMLFSPEIFQLRKSINYENINYIIMKILIT